ncbi:F-box domain [Dillenia turbinata]|uniref:F-box domain n=1 Tax=Dillenia turbinata TaxID=194707 RepID=A0AAN8UN26_9MAGN
MSSNIPGDILADVLLRLPVKSLFRFKCVSKSWNSLISDSRFINSYTNSNHRKSRLVLHAKPRNRLVDLEAPSSIGGGDHISVDGLILTTELLRQRQVPEIAPSFQIIGSSRGLVCLSCLNNVYVLNPGTGEFRVVIPRHSAEVVGYGFGYDSSSDDYKVVRFYRWPSHVFAAEVEVFSLKSNVWRDLSDFKRYLFYDSNMRSVGVCLNGNIHWLSNRKRSGRSCTFCVVILAFSLAEEGFHELPLPYDESSVRLGVLGGCLSVVTCHYTEDSVFVVSIMEEYGLPGSWTKLFTVPQSQPAFGYIDPLCFTENGDVLMLTDDYEVEKPSGGMLLVLYNVKENKVCRVSGGDDIGKFSSAAMYVESLISPNLGIHGQHTPR